MKENMGRPIITAFLKRVVVKNADLSQSILANWR